MTDFIVPKTAPAIPMPDDLFEGMPGQANHIMRLNTNSGRYIAYPRFRMATSEHFATPGNGFTPLMKTSADLPVNLLTDSNLPFKISVSQFDNQLELWSIQGSVASQILTGWKTGIRGQISWSGLTNYNLLVFRLRGYIDPEPFAYSGTGEILTPRRISTLGDLCIVKS